MNKASPFPREFSKTLPVFLWQVVQVVWHRSLLIAIVRHAGAIGIVGSVKKETVALHPQMSVSEPHHSISATEEALGNQRKYKMTNMTRRTCRLCICSEILLDESLLQVVNMHAAPIGYHHLLNGSSGPCCESGRAIHGND